MKVCLFAHQWHYIDNLSPLIRKFNQNQIAYDILICRKLPDVSSSYFDEYKNIICLNKNKVFKLIHYLNRLPIVGSLSIFFSILYFLLFLKKQHYTHIIFSDDRCHLSRILLFCANKLGLDTILYPIEDTQDIMLWVLDKHTRQSRQKKAGYINKFIKSCVKRLNPNSVKNYKGDDVFFTVPNTLTKFINFLLFKSLGLLSDNPWVRGSNFINKIAVNSKAQKGYNIAAGMDSKKIHVTGFPQHDNLRCLLKNRDKIRNDINKELHLDPHKKVFLIVGTHLLQIWKKEELPRINFLLSEIVSTIADLLDEDYQVIFKVHPRENIEDQKHIFDSKLQEKIIFVKKEYSVYELISISDCIFMFLSAVALAALSTNVPIIVYELKKIPQFTHWYGQFKSVILLNNIEDLKAKILKVENGILYDNKMDELRKKDRENYLMLDGKNTERCLELLYA